VPHALLFSGIEGLGKRKVAQEFIKILNCTESGREPCGQCFSCLNIENRRHLDFLVIEPVIREIQIEQIRDLQKFLSYSNQIAQFKAVIIDNAHRLNQEAQSCLLKCLEEPQGKAIIILVSSHPEALFATIVSRCGEIKFYPTAVQDIANALSTYQNNPYFQEIIAWSDGRPGLAIRFFEDKALFEQCLSDLKLAEHLLKGDLAERLMLVKDYWSLLAKNDKESNEDEIEKGEVFQTLYQFLENFTVFLRGLLKKTIAAGGGDWPVSKLVENLKKAEDLKFLLLNSNINKRLLLENLVLNL